MSADMAQGCSERERSGAAGFRPLTLEQEIFLRDHGDLISPWRFTAEGLRQFAYGRLKAAFR